MMLYWHTNEMVRTALKYCRPGVHAHNTVVIHKPLYERYCRPRVRKLPYQVCCTHVIQKRCTDSTKKQSPNSSWWNSSWTKSQTMTKQQLSTHHQKWEGGGGKNEANGSWGIWRTRATVQWVVQWVESAQQTKLTHDVCKIGTWNCTFRQYHGFWKDPFCRASYEAIQLV